VRVTPWTEWLDRHIPYYEAERLRSLYQHRPPQVVLELSVVDRHRYNHPKTPATDAWLSANAQFNQYQTEPIFLTSDTHQRWFWAFWDKQEALVAVIML
jgi:hypothetical protein